MTNTDRPAPLPVAALRWRCDPSTLGFSTTDDIDPAPGIVGQDAAVASLQFGIEINAPGQNVYVRGLSGTGRLSLVRELLEEIRPESPPGHDVCYVHNFAEPDRPRALRFPRGEGKAFCERMADFRRFIVEDLAAALRDELVQQRRAEIERRTVAEIDKLTKPIEQELETAGLALGVVKAGGVAQPVILPVIGGEPAPPEKIAALRAEGALSDEAMHEIEEKIEAVRVHVDDVFGKVAVLQRSLRKDTRALVEHEARRAMLAASADLRRDFGEPGVAAFLDAVIDDVLHEQLPKLDPELLERLYNVNLLISRSKDETSPVIVENAPSLRTLVGTVDAIGEDEGRRHGDHMSIHAGSLLRADGGVIVMEASEVIASPGAWAALVRTLRSGRVEIVPPDTGLPWLAPAIKPEPVEVNVKVVLLGESWLYYTLDQHDPDFPNLFKVLADFDSTLPRDDSSLRLYAGVLARIAKTESLLPFGADAVAALAEHGARIAAARGKLTARFGRLADIAREAAYLARKSNARIVDATHVQDAVRRTKARADAPVRRLWESIKDGSIRIATSGTEVGQVNGLAVIQAGPLTYGFPTRITATLGPGVGGAINIDREAQLSGAIHTKAFYILGGLLRRLLQSSHPLTFTASIAFEQSYGGIDGDSASGAEICCLLSALTGLPMRQGLAMTGAIDQMGNILPIGAVNEKLEGFFDACCAQGLTGEQGAIIPAANVGDLMLRHDVVEACARGEFAVYPVESINEALALFFDRDPGSRQPPHSDGSVLAVAVERARLLYERSSAP